MNETARTALQHLSLDPDALTPAWRLAAHYGHVWGQHDLSELLALPVISAAAIAALSAERFPHHPDDMEADPHTAPHPDPSGGLHGTGYPGEVMWRVERGGELTLTAYNYDLPEQFPGDPCIEVSFQVLVREGEVVFAEALDTTRLQAIENVFTACVAAAAPDARERAAAGFLHECAPEIRAAHADETRRTAQAVRDARHLFEQLAAQPGGTGALDELAHALDGARLRPAAPPSPLMTPPS